MYSINVNSCVFVMKDELKNQGKLFIDSILLHPILLKHVVYIIFIATSNQINNYRIILYVEVITDINCMDFFC